VRTLLKLPLVAASLGIAVTELLAQPALATTRSPSGVVTGTRSGMKPLYTASVTATVRCGKFTGTIKHGGNGGVLDKAYLDIDGKVSSSCNSKTRLQAKYNVVVLGTYEPVIKTVGARQTATVSWSTSSAAGTYSEIGVRVCTTDGMKSGKWYCGAWKNV
jgi:hypothetical protein